MYEAPNDFRQYYELYHTSIKRRGRRVVDDDLEKRVKDSSNSGKTPRRSVPGESYGKDMYARYEAYQRSNLRGGDSSKSSNSSVSSGGNGRGGNSRSLRNNINDFAHEVQVENNLKNQLRSIILSSGVQFGNLQILGKDRVTNAALRQANAVINQIKDPAKRGEAKGIWQTLWNRIND